MSTHLRVREVRQVADAGHVAGEQVDRFGPLQRQVVHVVVEQQRAVAARRMGGEQLVAGAAAVDDLDSEVGARIRRRNREEKFESKGERERSVRRSRHKSSPETRCALY